MRARYFVRGLTGIVAGVALFAVMSLIADPVSAKALRPGDSNRFEPAAELRFASLASRQALNGQALNGSTAIEAGAIGGGLIEPLGAGQAGQSVRLEVAAPASLRDGAVLQPVDVALPLATRSLAIPSFAVQARMNMAPYLSAAASPAQQAGFASGDLWSAWPGDMSALARHMAAHEPQRVISAADSWWLVLVGIMLVTYQLRRKHIFLRPKPFGF